MAPRSASRQYQYRVSHITRIEDGEKFLDTPLFAHEPKHYVILCGFAYFQSILWKVVTAALANCERWESFPALEHALRLRARAGPPRPSTMAPSPAPSHMMDQHHLAVLLRLNLAKLLTVLLVAPSSPSPPSRLQQAPLRTRAAGTACVRTVRLSGCRVLWRDLQGSYYCNVYLSRGGDLTA